MQLRCLALCLVAALVTPATSQRPEKGAIELFPRGQVPGERKGTVYHETDQGSEADLKIDNVSTPILTPFLIKGTSAAVVVAPGGGYTHLAWGKEGSDIAKFLNSIGLSAFVLKYRVPGRPWLPFGEAPLIDAQRAMGWVRYHAEKYGLDPCKIGFMGFSAGGHLTGHISTNYSSRAYPRVDDADDVSCRPDFSLMVYPWKLVRDDDLRTLTLNITSTVPPFFIAQAEDDPVHVENSIFWMLGLKDAKAPPSELHVYPRGGHGYGRCTVGKIPWAEVCTWPDRARLFLQTLGVAPRNLTPVASILV